jgi:hypothetical protein
MVQLCNIEVVGSRVLVSKSRTRFFVVCPVKALAGIVAEISTTVSLLKSGVAVTAKYCRLALLPEVVLEVRDTVKVKFDRGSGAEVRVANSPVC